MERIATQTVRRQVIVVALKQRLRTLRDEIEVLCLLDPVSPAATEKAFEFNILKRALLTIEAAAEQER